MLVADWLAKGGILNRRGGDGDFREELRGATNRSEYWWCAFKLTTNNAGNSQERGLPQCQNRRRANGDRNSLVSLLL